MDIKEYLKIIDEVIEKGKYKDSWDSLYNYPVPMWYQNAKIGIFVHWGVYSVPAFRSEWYPRLMYIEGNEVYDHHIENYGKVSEFGYKDFVPMFKAEKFDPNEWLDLFEEAGAKYIVPVGEHHDGIAMYSSELNEWNVMDMGPKRNILGELRKAAESKGIEFCTSSHRAEHFWFFNRGREIKGSDVNDDTYRELYGPAVLSEGYYNAWDSGWHNIFAGAPTTEWCENWLAHTCEMVDKTKPSLIYFDWWIHNAAFKPYLKKFLAFYYNRGIEWGKEVVVNYKYNAMPEGTAVFDIERGQTSNIATRKWQSDTATSTKAWCHIEDNEYKEAYDIICDLIDIVSKNGNLLINVGPKADGTIVEQDRKILKEMGAWLKVNGEGIYDSTFWKTFGEGPTVVEDGDFSDTNRGAFTSRDIRYTYKKGNVYAFVLRCPDDGKVILNEMKHEFYREIPFGNDYIVKDVTLLATGGECEYNRTNDALTIDIGDFKSDKPICFRISID